MSHITIAMKCVCSHKGTLTRKEFLCCALPCQLILSILSNILFSYVTYHIKDPMLHINMIGIEIFILWIITALYLYVTICIIIKRLRDEGLPCWLVVLVLVLHWYVYPYIWLPICLLKGRGERR